MKRLKKSLFVTLIIYLDYFIKFRLISSMVTKEQQYRNDISILISISLLSNAHSIPENLF